MYADGGRELAVNRGEVPGARVFASTRAMAPTGSPDRTPNWEMIAACVQDRGCVDNARLAVREQVQHGPTGSSTTATGYYFTTDSTLAAG